ncbi:MAG: LPS export ABC transporter periplasmic protein LptC [Bacteroidetes bacterium]|nr:LPS export ABC transporter periplasmic protein LptC [Bacteroidota bacterium]
MKHIWIFLFCILLFLGCEEKIKPSVLGGVSSESLPSQESWNSTITVTDSGIVKAIIKAGHIFSFDNSTVTHFNFGVKVDFFNEAGEHSSVLTSDSATVDEGSNNLEAFGHVIVRSDSGVVVMTEKLFWNNTQQLIHSPEFVRIQTPTEKLQGTGFESDASLKNYKIFKVMGQAESK